MNKKAIIFFAVGLVLVSSAVFAAEAEYYVYNGFDAVLNAFQKLALIFGDNGYKTLFFSVVVLGILFGGTSVMAKAALGARFSLLAWAIPVGIGVIIYLALIVPKGTIHLYDPVKNRYQAIGGIPDGIVAAAGVLNKIEKGLIDIVSTSGSPMSYQDQAGGVGFDMFYNIGTRGILLADRNVHNNLKEYIQKCVFFELLRPGTQLKINDIMNNDDFLSLFAQAQNPSIYTVYYSDSKPEGETMSCTQAWTLLTSELQNSSTFQNPTKAMCANAGFDPGIPAEYTRCQEILSNTTNWIYAAGYELTHVMRQTFITEMINDVVMAASPDTVARLISSRDTGTSWLSGGMVANEYVPILRAVLTSVALGLIPFFVLFIPTPLVGRALSIIAGFFLWLTAWGVTDAVIHQFAINYARKAYMEVAEYKLGMMAINAFGIASMKTLAAFASMRWSGLMLATIITGMLVRFGGHALAMMAGHITGGVSAAAASGGNVAAKPEAGAQMLNAMETAPATFDNAYSFGHRLRSGIAAASRKGYTQRDAGLVEKHGFGGLQNMIAETGQFGMESNYSAVQAMGGPGNAHYMGKMEGTHRLENTTGYERNVKNIGNELGLDPNTDKGFRASAIEKGKINADIDAANKITEMRNKELAGQDNLLEYELSKKMAHMQELGALPDASGFKQMLARSGITGSTIDDGWMVAVSRDTRGNVTGYVARSQDGKDLEKFEGGKITSNTAISSQAGTFNLEQVTDKQGNIIDTRMRGLVKEGTVLGKVNGKNLVAGKGMQMEAHGGQTTFTGDTKHGGKAFYGRAYGDLATPINRDNAASVMDTMAERGSGIIFTNIERGTIQQDGTFVREGLHKTKYNEYTETGIFKDIDPFTGKETLFHGVRHIDPKTGKVIASQAGNIHDKRIYTHYTDEDGNKVYGVMHSEGSGGVHGHVYNFKTLSSREIQKGNYAARMTLSPHGEVLYTEGQGGQQFAHYHRTKFFNDSGANLSYSQWIVRTEKDLSKVSDSQVAGLYAAGAADKLVGTVAKGIGGYRALNRQYPKIFRQGPTLIERADIKGPRGGGSGHNAPLPEAAPTPNTVRVENGPFSSSPTQEGPATPSQSGAKPQGQETSTPTSNGIGEPKDIKPNR